jgi:hypothetical protein
MNDARKPAAQQARPDGHFLRPAPNRFLAAARRVKHADLDSGLSAKEAILKITYYIPAIPVFHGNSSHFSHALF